MNKKIVSTGVSLLVLSGVSVMIPRASVAPKSWTLKSGNMMQKAFQSSALLAKKAMTLQVGLTKAQAAAAIYPLDLVTVTKAISDPLVDPDQCTTENDNGGLAPAFM